MELDNIKMWESLIRECEKSHDQSILNWVFNVRRSLADQGLQYNSDTKKIESLEPKPFEIKKGKWYICLGDIYDTNNDIRFFKGKIYQSTSDGFIDHVGMSGYNSLFRPATPEEIPHSESEQEELSEQKPAWSEEDERMYKAISIALSLKDAKGYLSSWYKTPEEADNWLKSLKDRVQPKQEWSEENTPMSYGKELEVKMNETCRRFYSQDEDAYNLAEVFFSGVKAGKELVEQKPEWNKKNDYNIRWCISLLKTMQEKGIDDRYGDSVPDDIPNIIDWLKSLRPQKKTYYWTENEIKFAISDYIRGAESYEKMVEKLRCLKPQPHWKPSESVILLLERIANGKYNPQDFQASLGGLVGQLKKLREE